MTAREIADGDMRRAGFRGYEGCPRLPLDATDEGCPTPYLCSEKGDCRLIADSGSMSNNDARDGDELVASVIRKGLGLARSMILSRERMSEEASSRIDLALDANG